MKRSMDCISRRTLGLLLLFLSFTAPQLRAQSYYGSLRGQVTDAQSASVAGAIATLTNEATHITRKAASNSAGEYVFASLDPGTYTLSISASGFKKLDRKGITISTQQTLTLDAKLEVGTATQSIEVTSSDPLIDTSTASNGQVFDTQKLNDLPNLGRNPFLFSKLDNNVTPVGDPRFNRFQDQSGSSQISIAGGPINGNNYEIDGVPITDFFNRAVIIPSLDSVQEVKVQSTTYDAEMGRTGGGVFNTLLKSGTNTLHGNLYGETRQTGWAANTWFNDHKGIKKGDSTQYQYEGSIGGPVTIPHLYNGKDKTFFWLTEEGYRQRSPLTGSYYIPTAAERAGDFSADGTVNPDGSCTGLCIYDPTTTTANGKVVRTAFSGNIIPAGRISAVGAALLAAIPTCSSVPGAACSTASAYGATNMTNTDLLGDRADEFIGKVDHQFTNWWLANASYMHYGSKEPGGNPLGSFAGTGGTSYLLYRKVDAFQENNTFTINPTTVATVAFGFNRFPNNTVDLSNGYDQSALGFPSSYVSALQKKAFPAITMQSAASVGTNNSGPAVFYSRNFVVGISKSLGKHTLKAGYVFRSISVDFENISYGNGQYSFDSTFTSADATASTSSGADVADMLLGLPTSGSVQTTTRIALNTHYNAGYIQDDIRVTPKLTVNAGLRYEWEPGIRERNNHYAVGFDRTVVNPISSTSGVNTLGGIMFAGQNGYSTTCCDNSKTKFAPRFGLVYALGDKTVVRGGFGVFYAPLMYSTNGALAPGYTQTNTYIYSNDSGKTAANSVSDPFPAGMEQPSGNVNGYSTGLGSAVTAIDQYRRSPLVEQYSADIERQLPAGFALQVGYVGSKGRNLQPGNGTTSNINQLPDQYLSMGSAALKASVNNPYYGHGGTGVIGSSQVSYQQLLRPFPEFSTVNLQTSAAHSLYNAFNLKLQKRFQRGFTMLAAYTWSSNWDSTYGASDSINAGNNGPQDAYNLNGEYARAINDIPNRFTMAITYELPFGMGKQFLSGNRWLDLAVGGWSINAITNVQNGGPLAITQSNNKNSAYGMAVQRPMLIGNPCSSGKPQDRLTNYMNASAFSTTPELSFGNTSRTIGCYGPGYDSTDLSLFKTFKVKEKVNFQFRAEALNAFNTPQFATPNTSYGNKNFGAITATKNFPRYIALGGRISF